MPPRNWKFASTWEVSCFCWKTISSSFMIPMFSRCDSRYLRDTYWQMPFRMPQAKPTVGSLADLVGLVVTGFQACAHLFGGRGLTLSLVGGARWTATRATRCPVPRQVVVRGLSTRGCRVWHFFAIKRLGSARGAAIGSPAVSVALRVGLAGRLGRRIRVAARRDVSLADRTLAAGMGWLAGMRLCQPLNLGTLALDRETLQHPGRCAIAGQYLQEEDLSRIRRRRSRGYGDLRMEGRIVHLRWPFPRGERNPVRAIKLIARLHTCRRYASPQVSANGSEVTLSCPIGQVGLSRTP